MAVATSASSGAQTDFPGVKDEHYFAEERQGWKGYVEWERYPEKKKQAKETLAQYKFPGPPEFQLAPLPKTNPLLEGVRFKQYHYALGKPLKDYPQQSWEYVEKEKAEDMLHILQVC